MRLLLDTHAFLWWIADDERLSPRAAALIGDGSNEVLVSAASAWEIVVKSRLGRVEVPAPVERFFTAQLVANAFVPLPIQMRHALGLEALPDVHALELLDLGFSDLRFHRRKLKRHYSSL